jgi:hypothetical protein
VNLDNDLISVSMVGDYLPEPRVGNEVFATVRVLLSVSHEFKSAISLLFEVIWPINIRKCSSVTKRSLIINHKSLPLFRTEISCILHRYITIHLPASES